MKRVLWYSAFIFLVYAFFRLLLTTDFHSVVRLPAAVVPVLTLIQGALLKVKPFAGSMEDLWIFGLFLLILRTLEHYWPADTSDNDQPTGSDLTYSIFAKIGAFWFLMTLTSHPLMDHLQGFLVKHNIPFFNLQGKLADLSVPLALSAVIQWFIFDGFDTLRHRVEYHIGGLWAFHSVHHSQTKMTMLTFDRNHVVSLFYNSIYYACLGRFLGIHIGVLTVIYVGFNFIEYLTHSNVNIAYGKILDKIIVCPLYHRTHHASANFSGHTYGRNFANIFPVWDILMGTADFSYTHIKTGIFGEDETQLGRNFIENQISGFRKFFNALLTVF